MSTTEDRVTDPGHDEADRNNVIDCLFIANFGETEERPTRMLTVEDDCFDGPGSVFAPAMGGVNLLRPMPSTTRCTSVRRDRALPADVLENHLYNNAHAFFFEWQEEH